MLRWISKFKIGTEKKTVRILTIDGGGIRGIIPLHILMKIQKEMKKPIHQIFDVISGSSTGGIITLGLTAYHFTQIQKPLFSAESLLSLYSKEGKKIFEPFTTQGECRYFEQYLHQNQEYFSEFLSKSLQYYVGLPIKILLKKKSVLEKCLVNFYLWIGKSFFEKSLKQHLQDPPIRQILNKLVSKYFHPKYNSRSLKKTLNDHGFHQQNMLKSLSTVLIPAFSLTTFQNQIFSSVNSKCFIIDVAMATSAAPTYFDPYDIQINGSHHLCIDGGISINNPTLLAYIEARKLFPQANQFVIVSLGTGSPTDGKNQAPVKDGGLFGIAKNFHLFNDSQVNAAETLLLNLFQMDEGLGIHAIGSYFRLQESLDKSYSELDNVNCETITYLNNIARKYVERECAPTGRLTQIIEKLKIERTIDGKLVDVLIPNLHLQKKPNVDDQMQKYQNKINKIEEQLEQCYENKRQLTDIKERQKIENNKKQQFRFAMEQIMKKRQTLFSNISIEQIKKIMDKYQ